MRYNNGYIGGLDEGGREELNIPKTPTNSRNNGQNTSNIPAKVVGIAGLLASIAFFIVASVVNPLYAIGGAAGLLVAIICITTATLSDYNKSQGITTPPSTITPQIQNAPQQNINNANTITQNVPTQPNINNQCPPQYNTYNYNTPQPAPINLNN